MDVHKFLTYGYSEAVEAFSLSRLAMRSIVALLLTPALAMPLAAFSCNGNAVFASTIPLARFRARQQQYGGGQREMAQAPSLTRGTINVSKNLARQAGERVNGGLGNYRAEDAMHGPALEAPYRDAGDRWIFTFKGRSPDSQQFTIETEVSVHKETLEVVVLYNGLIRDTPPTGNRNPMPNDSPPPNPDTSNEVPTSSSNAVSPQSEPAVELDPIPEPIPPTDPRAVPVPPPTPAPEPIPDSSALPILTAPGDITSAKNYARQAAERANGGLSNYRAEPAMHGPALEAPYEDAGDRWIFTFRGGAPGDAERPIESQVAVNKSTFETTILYNGGSE